MPRDVIVDQSKSLILSQNRRTLFHELRFWQKILRCYGSCLPVIIFFAEIYCVQRETASDAGSGRDPRPMHKQASTDGSCDLRDPIQQQPSPVQSTVAIAEPFHLFSREQTIDHLRSSFAEIGLFFFSSENNQPERNFQFSADREI